MQYCKFNEFEIDSHAFQLRRAGARIEIGRRSFDLLQYLIKYRHRVVSTNELLSEVWQAKALSPSAIPTCMLELRKLLGENAQHSAIIRTVRGRGYQFVAKITPSENLDAFTKLTDGALPFAGRDSEMQALRSIMNAVESSSTCQTVVVRGDAGIGKTRLIQEFLRQTQSDFRSFVVRCPELDGAPPYWPWKRLLGQIENSTAINEFREASGDDLKRKHWQTDDPPTTSQEIWDGFTNKYSIFNTWSNIVRALCRKSPLLLVFEDLHRTDIDSIDLLRWIADDLQAEPLLLIGSNRYGGSEEPATASLSAFSAGTSSTVVNLPLLTEPSILEMVTGRTNWPEELATVLHERTAGNPFFIQRILNMPKSLGEHTDIDSAIASIPFSSDEILAYQLRDLSAATLRALEVASVFGKQFPALLAASTARMCIDDFLSDLEPARSAGIISKVREDPERMQFTHMILRDALYGSLSTKHRRKLHAEIACGLIESEGHAYKDSAGVVAEHLEQALPVSTLTSVSDYSRIAGRVCLERFAFREARSFFLKVRNLVDRDPSASPENRCIARFDLAESELYSEDRDAARAILFEAAEIARSAKLPCLVAECGIRVSPDFLSIEVGSFDPELVRLLLEALETLPNKELSLRSRVMARLSLALSWSGSSERSARYAFEALSIARKLNDSEALSAALAAKADVLHGPDRVGERLEVTAELEKAVRRQQNRPGIIMQHIRQIAALLDSGQIQKVDVEINACEASVREMNVPQYLWYPIAFRAMRSIMRGDFEIANELGDKYLAIGMRTHDSNVTSSRACQICALEIERDRGKEALPFAVEFVNRYPDVRAWAAGLGLLHLNARQNSNAFDILATFDFDSIRHVFRETGGSAGVAFLAEIAIEANDTERIAQLYDLCCPVGQRSATLGFGMGYFGCFSRYAGLLASSLGLVSESLEHLRTAVAMERHRGATLWRLHAELDLALALFRSAGKTPEVESLIESVKLSVASSELRRAKHRYRNIAAEIF